jgi:uncharacterized membrane protein
MFKQKRVNRIIEEIASRKKLPRAVVEAVVRSQFEAARKGTENKLNTRFPNLMLLYCKDTKNPDYVKHKTQNDE